MSLMENLWVKLCAYELSINAEGIETVQERVADLSRFEDEL